MYDNVAYQISASKVKNCGVGVILCDHVYSIALAGFFTAYAWLTLLIG